MSLVKGIAVTRIVFSYYNSRAAFPLANFVRTNRRKRGRRK